MVGAAPFALMGFFRYQGLPLERVLFAWFRSQLVYPRRMHLRAKNERIAAMRAQRKRRRPAPKKTPKQKKTAKQRKNTGTKEAAHD